MKVSWKDEGVTKVRALTFEDLNVGESFKIDTPASRGAVYVKVDLGARLDDLDGYYDCDKDKYGQLEVATGKVFTPTKSPVKRVDVSVTINEVKPALYE
jgi:hypothetical protein